MKFLRKFFFFLTLLGLLFLVLNIRFTAKQERVLECKPSLMEAVYVDRKEGGFFITKESAEDWILHYSGRLFQADRKQTQNFSTLLCYLTYSERFAVQNGEDLQEYGLAAPETSLRLLFGKTVLLKVGAMTPSGVSFYLSSSENPDQIYILPNRFRQILTFQWMSLRSRYPFEDLKTGSVALRYGDREFLLEENQGEWSEKRGFISSSQGSELVSLLTKINFSNYHGPMPPEQANQYGFFLPEIGLIIDDREYFLSRYVGRFYLMEECPDGHYVLVLEPYIAGLLNDFLKKSVTLTE